MTDSLRRHLKVSTCDAPLPLGTYVKWRPQLNIELGLKASGPWEVLEETSPEEGEGLPAVMATPDRKEGLVCLFDPPNHPVCEVDLLLEDKKTTLVTTFRRLEDADNQFQGVRWISGQATDLSAVIESLVSDGPVGVVYGKRTDWARPTAVVRECNDRGVLNLIQSSGFGGFDTLFKRYRTVAITLERQLPLPKRRSSFSDRSGRQVNKERIEELKEIYLDITWEDENST